MSSVKEILAELESLGSEQTRKTFARHGADIKNMFGVKVGDLKIIAKKIKHNQSLALELYESGNSDAQYLAGLVADGSLMTKKQLESWAKKASWQMVSEYTVAWVASENESGRELALKWMDSKNESIASSGWATYSAILSIKPDESLDLEEIESLLHRVLQSIHSAPNRLKYVMNSFVIAVGVFVKPLNSLAKTVAKKIGTVDIDVGDTSCKVPVALDYIAKCESSRSIGKKRKSVKC